ncbi:TPR domain protein putative component of TonB system [Paramagnetospirillum magnetotacticum MS-1]|uniref:protein O-GlcNAc transferase n=1 Tax=Paramagnetospirillum magnetotacticum MS-1 TaxID=272627 RepID=A0A0C2V042_PARME|nr:tetratricopeptide repeat protein [Paramagnetospirillum magnetotacticum]KIL98466.1 TPR domain protein putative component of TonB system [Paramagnetospirillum magnetotacticum MS-1]
MSADLQFIFRQGVGALQQGQWDEAARQFRTLTTRTPNAPEPLYYLGVALLSGGKPDEAAEALTRLIRKHGDNPMALNALGSAQAASGRSGPAEKSFKRALALAPDLSDAAENLARVLIETRRAGEALAPLHAVLAREPGRFISRHLLGRALRDSGDMEGALAAFKAVLDAQPNFTAAINDLGLLHYACGKGAEALECFERLLKLNPDDHVAANNRALTLRVLNRPEEAEEQYRAILKRHPDAPEVNLNLGKLIARTGRAQDAAPFLAKGDCIEARWWDALVLPNQYETEEQVTSWRQRFTEKLDAVAAEIHALPPLQLPAQAGILELDVFFLAYQAKDDRVPMTVLRGAQAKVAQACHGFGTPVPPRPARPRISVGFVSQSFSFHVVCRLSAGWILGLDRDQFEVFVFHTGAKWDQATEALAAGVEHFVDAHAPVSEIIRMISEAELDVVIYPDIGLHPLVDRLALLRLAPVQCATHAHPVPTGMPTMDYFLSGELMEPENSEGHYTEKLVFLPRTGFTLDSPKVDEASPPAPEPERQGPRLFCAQSIYKMLPRRDHIFPRIVKAVGPCTIDFIDRFGTYTDIFRKRMERAFAEHGLNADQHIRVLPGVTSAEFLGLVKAADVSLDTLDWSGGYTTMEALACGTPVVAGNGQFLRGNFSAGILRCAGLGELVAKDEDAYVDLAARLATDADYREIISKKMAENRSRVFNDPGPVQGLADFLKSVTGRA